MFPVKLFILATSIACGTLHEENGVYSHTFMLHNESEDSIHITNAWTSCGCTTAEYDAGRWVAPGDSVPVTVRFDMNGKGGEFLETATLQVESRTDTIRQTLTLEGEVIPSQKSIEKAFPVKVGKLRLSTGQLDFGQMKRGENKTMDIAIYGAPPLHVTFTADKGWGEQHPIQTVTYDGTKIPVHIKVLIIDNAQGAQRLSTSRRLQPGSSSFILTNVGSAPLVIHRAYTSAADIISKDVSVAPGKSKEVAIPSASLNKDDDTLITVISNDSQSSRTTIRLLKR